MVYSSGWIRQSGIRLRHHRQSRPLRQFFHQRPKFRRSQRTIHTYRIRSQAFAYHSHRLYLRTCKGSSVCLKAHRANYRQICIFLSGKQSRFHFIKICHRLYRNQIRSLTCENLPFKHFIRFLKGQISVRL